MSRMGKEEGDSMTLLGLIEEVWGIEIRSYVNLRGTL